jgi:hypothetical protein
VGSRGRVPLSPTHAPDYDLAWLEADDRITVVEVKSLRGENEDRQLRLALGQVLDYSKQLIDLGHSTVRPVVAVERPPRASRWTTLFNALGVTLIWPDEFDRLEHPPDRPLRLD